MYMRFRSSSRSKFHSRSFIASLDYSIVFKYSRRNQAFRLVVRNHPILLLQSMVISNQPGSARPVGSCQKFGTRLVKMRENDLLFQHFLQINFLLTMNPCRCTNVGTSMLLRKLRLIAIILMYHRFLYHVHVSKVILRTTLVNGF